MASKRTKHAKPGTPAAPSAQPLLDKTATFYQDSLCESLPCKRFLKEHALTDHHVLESFGIGSCTGQLGKILPSRESSPQVYKNLTKLGILDATGKESLAGMLTATARCLNCCIPAGFDRLNCWAWTWATLIWPAGRRS
jgi:hypothetical protein